MFEEKVFSLQLTYNPYYAPRTREACIHAASRHIPPPTKAGVLSRLKMDAESNISSPNVEALTDVSRDIQYYAEVEIGSNEQKFRLNFDTGSSDLWVPDSACKTTQAKFDKTQSKTFQTVKGKFQIGYGDGSRVQGVLGQDTVYVAGLKIENQVFGIATRLSTSFSNDVIDGILGLGYNTIACVPGTKTVMDNLIEQKLIKEPIF
ncbi:Type I transmembrane sorting receptor, partial [Lunasporangiospora selenospora]